MKEIYGQSTKVVGCLKFRKVNDAKMFIYRYNRYFKDKSLAYAHDVIYISNCMTPRLKEPMVELYSDEASEPYAAYEDARKLILVSSNKERIDVDGREKAEERSNSGEKECVRQS